MSTTGKPKPWKQVVQVDFRPTFALLESIRTAASVLEDSGFGEWQTNGFDVVLKDFSTRSSVQLHHVRLVYEQDSSDLPLFKNRVSVIEREILPSLMYKSVTRFGCLATYVVPIDVPFDTLLKLMRRKLISSEDDWGKILTTSIDDFFVQIDFKDDLLAYHYKIGPVHRAQLPRWMRFNKDNHLDPATAAATYAQIEAGYPEVAAFFEINSYQEDESLDSSLLGDFVRASLERSAGIAARSLSHILS